MSRPALIQVSEAPPTIVGNSLTAKNRRAAVTVRAPQESETGGPVCIVDDDEWVCDSLSVLLETYGFSVVTYASGTEFLNDDRRGDARCLVIDLHMPEVDGLDVIAELRRDGVLLPTVLITGKLESTTAERAGMLGVVAILEKPFRVAQLVDLVRAAVAVPH